LDELLTKEKSLLRTGMPSNVGMMEDGRFCRGFREAIETSERGRRKK
jgi:hypothetical protein